jgi:hypothetical protein
MVARVTRWSESLVRYGAGLLAAVVLAVVPASLAWAKPPAAGQSTAGGDRSGTAQSAAAADPDRLARIKKLMDQGQALFVARQFKQAAEVFERGFREHPYSAFLYNAGVCRQKAGETDPALALFHRYLQVDPGAPDAAKVRARVAALEALKAAKGKPGKTTADQPSDGGMKSLVVVETEPAGAPIRIFARVDPAAAAFDPATANPGWSEVIKATAPANLTVDVGHYHVVIDEFRDFHSSSTDVDVEPGHVHQIKVSLSQGEFMAFLRVASNVRAARVSLDDPAAKRPIWGTTPHGELVPAGTHAIHVEAPGYEPLDQTVELAHGEQKELVVKLERVKYGFLEIDGNVPTMRISVDDQPADTYIGGQSAVSVKVDAGRHRLRASADGFKTYSGVVEVKKGRVQPVHVRLIEKPPRGAAWTQAIIGGVVLGAGVYFGVESNRLNSELESDRQRGVLEQGDERIARGRVFSIVADVGFGGAALLGLLATHSFLKDPTPDSGVHSSREHEFRGAQAK